MKCQHILKDAEIVSEEQRTIKCKKCGKIFNNTEEQFKLIKSTLELSQTLHNLIKKVSSKGSGEGR